MDCELFVDYTRECIKDIGFIPPANSYDYCQADKHIECPFFKTIKKIGPHCDCLEKCAAYNHFRIYNFGKFVEIANEYCLTENNVNCARHKMRKSGQTPPENLMPDGSMDKR